MGSGRSTRCCLVAACGRKVSRASRKPRSSGGRLRGVNAAKVAPSSAPYLSRCISLVPLRRKKEGPCGKRKSRNRRKGSGSDDAEDEEKEAVWRKPILTGKKCRPLDFSGVIYYDSEGRQLPGLPLRSPLLRFSCPLVISSENSVRKLQARKCNDDIDS